MKSMRDKQKKCGRKSCFDYRNLIQTTFQAFSDDLSSADIFKNKSNLKAPYAQIWGTAM
jgi:hypothetical protein